MHRSFVGPFLGPVFGLLLALTALVATRAGANCICLKCLSPEFEMFRAVSSSMDPTLGAGACATARHVDGTGWQPTRGDVIVFRHPTRGLNWIFRVIGLPGDQIRLVDGIVILNGAPLPRTPEPDFTYRIAPQGPRALTPRCPSAARQGDSCALPRYREVLPSGAAYSVVDMGEYMLDTTPVYRVPPGHVFVLGDNRDNASDSRVAAPAGGPGFVPVTNVVGVFDALSPQGAD